LTNLGNDRVPICLLILFLSSEIQLSQSGDRLIISVPSTGDSFTALWQYYNNGVGYGVNEIQFADGAVWNRSAINDALSTFTFNGSSTNSTLIGNTYRMSPF
jgi:Haemolysin-type calcium binding protein related domain